MARYAPQDAGASELKLKDTRLTIVHPFYNDEKRFDVQFKNWGTYPKDLKKSIDIILVDDCSKHPLSNRITKNRLKYIDFNFRILRITDDLKWNTPGALNLGVTSAQTDWVVFMDSDCLFKADDIEKLLSTTPEPNSVYNFERIRVSKDIEKAKITRLLGCAYLLEKETFLSVHGFDEDFTGEYSKGYGHFDNQFTNKLKKRRIPFRRTEAKITEYMEDTYMGPNIQTKDRIRRETHDINKRLMYKKDTGEIPIRRDMLNFSWVESFNFNASRL